MKELLLIACFAALVILGYWIMDKIDHFLEKNRQAIAEKEEPVYPSQVEKEEG